MAKENLLILGGTGYIGTYITNQIVKAKETFGRIKLFTSQKTADTKKEALDKLRAEGVEVIVGDVSKEEEMSKAYQGILSALQSTRIVLGLIL